MCAIKNAIEYILKEVQSFPNDSLVDIANDAFEKYSLPLECDENLRISNKITGENKIVNLMCESGFGGTNSDNDEQQIEKLVNEYKTLSIKLSAILGIAMTPPHSGRLESLQAAIQEALETYDVKMRLADIILEADGMEEAIIDSLEQRGWAIKPSN